MLLAIKVDLTMIKNGLELEISNSKRLSSTRGRGHVGHQNERPRITHQAVLHVPTLASAYFQHLE